MTIYLLKLRFAQNNAVLSTKAGFPDLRDVEHYMTVRKGCESGSGRESVHQVRSKTGVQQENFEQSVTARTDSLVSGLFLGWIFGAIAGSCCVCHDA